MIVVKEFTFDAAHKLINYDGKCKNLHGHTYKIRISIKGQVNKESGFLMDFGDVKKIVKENVIDIFDHSYINDIIEQPTAENMIIWIWNKLKSLLPLYEIWLWETPTSYVVYHGEYNENQ
ncbi:MAG: 6-carboxytetrahydropterin synthase QueD [Nanoarchaeota archaeon]|nr:6-carboxytetrahydropterin synthase QueD [Nanoarchaeota archaeon]